MLAGWFPQGLVPAFFRNGFPRKGLFPVALSLAALSPGAPSPGALSLKGFLVGPLLVRCSSYKSLVNFVGTKYSGNKIPTVPIGCCEQTIQVGRPGSVVAPGWSKTEEPQTTQFSPLSVSYTSGVDIVEVWK